MKMQSQKYSSQIDVLIRRGKVLEVLNYRDMVISCWKCFCDCGLMLSEQS
jgi:hypothetical protein